ncbi:MAG: methylenetetrahydrofolate--tRNA-(uracil(54)-C(5))-methyltransferase (FADH(2)-oxidizing) TrmFO [Bacillota bacterium]
MKDVAIIGGGLAGCEAAWQLAGQDINVVIYEMRPEKMTAAHSTDGLAELVCSNSLRSNSLGNAVGVLKEEMRRWGSLIMACADAHSVPAGDALAVDRHRFSAAITEKIVSHPKIRLVREEVTRIPREGLKIIASGPLTSEALAEEIQKITGQSRLYFYDAAAPIVSGDSIDFDFTFAQSRYGKGDDDYLNCPMDEEQYGIFYTELVNAQTYPLKEFEKPVYFEGCMPVEVMAKRGEQTLLFGPLKPVGLVDPRTGKRPHAVIQLRREDHEGTLYNMVGFQTNLMWPEQQRVFSLIPGLQRAEFIRYGFMHRNTFIHSPSLLLPTMQTRADSQTFFAGQITGVEGYVESAASGLVAGFNAARLLKDQEPLAFPPETVIGGLCQYITTADQQMFQPMKANFGILPPLEEKIRNKQQRYASLAQRSLTAINCFRENILLNTCQNILHVIT